MSATTSVAIDTPHQPPKRTMRSMCKDALRTLGGICKDATLWTLKHPFIALWWALKYLPFSGHLLALWWVMVGWIEVGDQIHIGSTHLSTATTMVLLAALSVSGETLRFGVVHVSRLKYFLIAPVFMMIGYAVIAAVAALGALPAFNTSTFYLMAVVVIAGLLATLIAGLAILQRSSEISDNR